MFDRKKLVYLDKVDSTNSYLKTGEWPDQTVVYTFNQFKGRGREERSWLTFPDKNIALSVLYRPELPVTNTIWYIASLSISMIRVLQRRSVRGLWIKWPNDVFIRDAKIAGVLAELVWKGGRQERLIAGIGININASPDELSQIDQKATSVFAETGVTIPLEPLVFEMADEMEALYRLILSGDIDTLRQEWLKYSPVIGLKALWEFQGQSITGIITRIDHDGFLYLDDGDTEHQIVSGDLKPLQYRNLSDEHIGIT